MEQFIQRVLAAAREAGITAAEIYLSSGDSFRAMCQQGQVNNYTVNSTRGLSLRGLYQGKMGYAATEAFDDEAVAQLVRGVKESAALIEDEDVQEIYPGDAEYPALDQYNPALDQVPEARKLQFVLDLEKCAKEKDPRIVQLTYDMLSTTSGQTRIANSYGLNLSFRDNLAVAVASALAKEGDRVSTGTGFAISREFEALSVEKIAGEAVEEALFMLHAAPVPSGTYRAIIHSRCMPDLLGVFSDVFSAENAQKGMSLLAGKEGEVIAAPCVTLMDDPLLPGGLASRPFDAEGVAARPKAVIENGRLTTLLHNLKTARKAGVKTTGNAAKGGYAGTVEVAPSNFYLKPGEKSLEQLTAEMGEGLVITDVSGLHAGANAISGDFSLIAQGYTVKNGRKDQPVERITVAGNFYQLLKSIRAVGSDLCFPGSSMGSPSVDVGEIAVAGK